MKGFLLATLPCSGIYFIIYVIYEYGVFDSNFWKYDTY